MRRTEKVEAALNQLHQVRDNGDEDGINPPTHVTREGWVYRSDTQCYAERLEYDFVNRAGALHMRDGSCTDMTGAIQLFQAIDANVEAIDTFAGGKPDTLYRKERHGWEAYRPAVDRT